MLSNCSTAFAPSEAWHRVFQLGRGLLVIKVIEVMREGRTLQAIIIHLGIAAKEGEALSPGGFEQERMSGNFEGLVEAIEGAPVVGRLVRLLPVRLQAIHNLWQKKLKIRSLLVEIMLQSHNIIENQN